MPLVHFDEKKNRNDWGTCNYGVGKMQDDNAAGHVARMVTKWKLKMFDQIN